MSNVANVAFIFPGQGSQATGMGRDLYDNFEAAKNIFDSADKILDRSISKICFEGSPEELKQTVNTQSALLTVSLAALETLKSKIADAHITPKFVAGHSLGEYGALYAAGVLDLENVMRAIQKRADVMNDACINASTATGGSGGTMAAVLGLEEEKILECLKEAQSKGLVSVANYNDPTQVVITGEDVAVAYASELLKAAGAKRVLPLAVSGAFHSEMMKSAADEFAVFVKDLKINDAKIPVITNVDAKMTTLAADFREKMPRQIYSSVYWTKTIKIMLESGIDTFVEIGAGKVLAGLNKKMCPAEVKTFNVFDSASLNETVEGLKSYARK